MAPSSLEFAGSSASPGGAKTGWRGGTAPAVPGSLAPSISLPLRFILTGVISLVIGLVIVMLRPDLLTGYHYNQHIIAVVHLWVLGFMTSVVMGAIYQLVPVALETRLYSERLARWQYPLHLCGFAGMVVMFWRWDLKQVGHFGSVLAVGVALLVFNIGRTLWRVSRWTVVATGLSSALFWLCLTVIVGLGVAAAKCTYESVDRLASDNPIRAALIAIQATADLVRRFDAIGVMHAHAHLGIVGFLAMTIMAVSYKLVPMFLLSDSPREHIARGSIWLLNVALLGLFVSIALRSQWKVLPAGIGAMAIGLYVWEVQTMIRSRRRRRIDWGLRYFLTAVVILVAAAALGVALSWPGLPVTEFTARAETIYGFLGIVGVITLSILGFLYKIVPFLVWYHRYSREVGRHRVPSLAELYSERLQVAGYWLFLGGLVLTAAGAMAAAEILVRLGAGSLLTSVAVFGVNLTGMLRHLTHPRLLPLPVLPPTSVTP